MCRLCSKNTDGAHRICAFEFSLFTKENWHCSTMERFKQLMRDRGTYSESRETAGCGVLPFRTEKLTGNLVLTWSFTGGRVHQAMVFWQRQAPLFLTETIAEDILGYYESEHEDLHLLQNHEQPAEAV